LVPAEVVGGVTAYVVAGRRVLAPAAERLLDGTAATEHAHEHARARVLLLRLCAMKKLGSTRIDGTVTELEENVARLRALEERTIVPELGRVLPLDVASSLARRVEVEHDVAVQAFRRIAARARAAEPRAEERVASAAVAA
jgi:hypothetical protein